MADYLFGFGTTAAPGKILYGPQPYEALVSEVCTTFGCVPSVAVQEDVALVRAVIDYRNAQAARDWLNEGEKGFEELAKHPQVLSLLLDMTRAQQGQDLTMAQMLALYRRQAAQRDAQRTADQEQRPGQGRGKG